MGGALQNSIQLQSGDLQIRAASYDENKVSLDWKDLVASPDQVIAQLKSPASGGCGHSPTLCQRYFDAWAKIPGEYR